MDNQANPEVEEQLDDGIPTDRRYSDDHFWAMETGGRVRIGMTAYATDALGDLQSLRLQPVESVVERNSMCGEVEANKSVSDVYAPVSGVIAAHNPLISSDVSLISTDPYGDGWLLELNLCDPAEFVELRDSNDYLEFLQAT
jgi:glycine cleavage system H protein